MPMKPLFDPKAVASVLRLVSTASYLVAYTWPGSSGTSRLSHKLKEIEEGTKKLKEDIKDLKRRVRDLEMRWWATTPDGKLFNEFEKARAERFLAGVESMLTAKFGSPKA